MKSVRSTRAISTIQLLNRSCMKLREIKGFMVGALVVASSLSVLAVVQIPNVFKPGDLITAEGMNQNFSSLKAGTDALEASVTAKQNRVSGTCAVGSSIRVVNADGTVECQLDNGGSGGSSYSAGTGLKLAGTQFSVDSTTVQSRVAGVCAAGSAIKEVKADGQVVCEAVGNTGGGVAGVSAVNGKTGGVTLESGSANLTVDNSQAGKVVFSVAGGSSYTAGLGLTLTGNQFLVDTSTIQARVNADCAASTYMVGVQQDGTPYCNPLALFGASQSGTSANTAFSMDNTGTGDGIFGTTYSSIFRSSGIKGFNRGTTGLGVGVYGQATDSPTGTGVNGVGSITGGYFEATGTPNGGYTPTGLYGVASQQGVGVKAQGGTALEVDGAIKVSGTNPAAFRMNTVWDTIVPSLIPIDNPLTNNDPNALIFVTPVEDSLYFEYYLTYSSNSKKWGIRCYTTKAGGYTPKEWNILIVKR
jgi:competence protein ComGC